MLEITRAGIESIHYNTEKFVAYEQVVRELKSESKWMKVVVAIPAGSGKTTLSRKYGWKDADDYNRNEADTFDAMRNVARESGDWKDYNDAWHGSIAKQFREDDSSVLLTHSVLPYYHEWPILSVKINSTLHENAIADRDPQHRSLSLMNWEENTEAITFDSYFAMERCIWDFKLANQVGERPFFEYSRLTGERAYDDNSVVRGQHDGQRKLLIADVQFLERLPDDVEVVVAGGAPGYHYSMISRMYPSILFHLYDTAEFGISESSNIKIHERLYDGKFKRQHYLISDIRSDDSTESDISNDMTTQARWARRAIESSLKFRAPFSGTIEYLDGVLVLQPWSGPRSTEMRLFTHQHAKTRSYEAYEIERRLAYHNLVRRPDFDHGRENAIIAQLSLHRRRIMSELPRMEGFEKHTIADFGFGSYLPMMHRDNRRNNDPLFFEALRRSRQGDGLDVLGEKDDFIIGLFSMSNVLNPTPVRAVEIISRSPRFIILYGNGDVSRFWTDGMYDIKLAPRVLEGQFRGSTVRDHCVSTANDVFPRFSRISNIAETLAAIRDSLPIDRLDKLLPFEGQHPLMRCWTFVTNFIGVDLMPQNLQTKYQSGTQNVRLPSLVIRYSFGLARQELSAARYLAAASYAISWLKHPYTLYNAQVICTIHRPSKPIHLEVSGHMINMLLTSTYGVHDYGLYLDTVRTNVTAYFVAGTDRRLIHRSMRRKILMEDQNNELRLWHSYHDYVVSLITVFYMCNFFRFNVPYKNIVRTWTLLQSLLNRFPNFDTNLKAPLPNRIVPTLVR
jgi:hypothetical protein